MNVSNGTPGQNTGDNSGFNTQPNQSIQRPQQSMGNTQQPNMSKPNNQMRYQQTGMGNMQQNVPFRLPFRNCVPTENEPINMHSQCIKTRSGYFPHIEIYT